MKPISNERVQWLNDRQKVLTECITLTQGRMYSMQHAGAARDDMSNAMKNFFAERTANAIELEILNKHFQVTE